MELKVQPKCPLNGFNDCKQLGCAWFTQMRGHNPSTGKEVDEWGCAVSWLPMLLVENSQMQRHTGKAVESMRNEIVRRMDEGVEPPVPMIAGPQTDQILLNGG